MNVMSVSAAVIRWSFSALLIAVLSSAAFAHEFWIEPTQYEVAENSIIEAYLRNGENFKGSTIAFVKAKSPRFELITETGVNKIGARLGDNPALKIQALQPGLHVIVHQSSTSVISYNTWDKFQRFADHKDFPDVLARHRGRSLPESQFKEAYTRYSKSLVTVGEGGGRDIQTGLEIELVALQNPYAEDLSEGLQLVGFYQDKILINTQIELFEKSPDEEVSVTLHRTNDQGLVTLPVKPSHRYLADMVVLREPSDQLAGKKKVVWETLWASLTFAVR